MLYGVANEPLNLTTTPLPSVQVPSAPIFENFTQNHAWYRLKNLPQTSPRPLKTCPEPAPNLPRTRSKKIENSGICPGPLKIMPWTCPGLGLGHHHPPSFCSFRSFFETRPAASQIFCKGCQLQGLLAETYFLIKHPVNSGKDLNLHVIVMAAGLSQFQ